MLTNFQELMVSATLRTFTGDVYVRGERAPGTPTETQIRIITPQPVRENDMNMLEDGERVSDWRATWIQEKYIVKIREGASASNEIIYDGVTYKNMQLNDRTVLGNFNRVVFRMVQ